MYNREDIALRRVVGADASILLEWENNVENWRVSDRSEPLSLQDILAFIESQAAEPFDLDQLRYMILVSNTQRCIGTVDLYEIDWEQDMAYVGILIASKEDRGLGAATHALEYLIQVSRDALELECLKARVHKDNDASQKLFARTNFKKKLEDLHPKDQDAAYIDCDIFERWLNE